MRYILIFLFCMNILNAQEHKYTNSLIDNTSPYLLQHAHNPVDWYAWDDKSLQKAKDEDKLIFLSIGYSTCHWCQVMEKESFENEELAKIFNAHYISIKVDREINSDVDIHYQNLLTSIGTNRNGWPLSVIMTPNLEVLYITTYIPPKFDYGVEGLDTLLIKYSNLYQQKQQLQKLIDENRLKISEKNKYEPKNSNQIEMQFVDTMFSVYDDGFKGFFKRPRFPYAANLGLLYDIYDLKKDEKAKKMLYESLDAMAKGGIYDQVEGAFFRYSVRQDWIIPHFEKMLYTTAELVPVYTRAYKDTNNPLYKKVVVQSLEEIQNRFFDGELFYSASNADSNGKEGEYFTFKYDTTLELLLSNEYTLPEAEENLEYLDITSIGNFEEDLSNAHINNNLEDDEVPRKLEQTIFFLQKIREKKTYPFVDKKILTSWNAMMIKAYLKAGSINKVYETNGLRYLDTLLEKHYKDGVLYHYSIGENIPTSKAILEDYAFLIDTLLYAYSINYDKKYFTVAHVLLKESMQKFYKNNQWYLSDDSLEIKANFIDRYYTSALGKMFENLITVSNMSYDLKLLDETKKMIHRYKNQILSDIANHSSGIKAMIRLEQGDIILKSNKYNLIANKDAIINIRYPFIYTKDEKNRDFLACDESTCFGYSDDFNGINKIIFQKLKNIE